VTSSLDERLHPIDHPPAVAATLSVADLSKSYGPVRAVDGVCFDIAGGEIFGLLGPNGAGKTTTVECAVGLREPDSGRVIVAGLDARRHRQAVKQRIGVALQATMLPDKITPREALGLFGSFYASGASPDELLERFALADKAKSRYETLSAGQRQRLAVALAMVNRPDVIVLDEPTAGLDPQSRRQLHDVIRESRSAGKAVLMTTHHIDEAQQLCDRIAVIDHGKVIAAGRPDELVARAKSPPHLTVATGRPLGEEKLRGLAGVTGVKIEGTTATIHTTTPTRTVVELVRLIEAEAANELVDLHIRKPSLEDVFIELTGRRLRD
jgi:ABC-2 type transport system ATP-binding protein